MTKKYIDYFFVMFGCIIKNYYLCTKKYIQ